MDVNGNLDLFTHHGGCPVLAGSKWITNKWIHTVAQWNKYPCTLTSPGKMHRLNPINNDVCKMTHNCDLVDVNSDFPNETKDAVDMSLLDLMIEKGFAPSHYVRQ